MALGATAATAATAAEAAVPSSSRPSQLLRPPREAFDESLLVRPLDASGSLLVFLNLSVSVAGRDWRHLELFPRAAAELVLASEAREAHLSLTSGRWLQEEWGVPPEPAPLGSALWAWLPAPSAADSFRHLASSLGALLCTSIGRLGGLASGGLASDGDGRRRALAGDVTAKTSAAGGGSSSGGSGGRSGSGSGSGSGGGDGRSRAYEMDDGIAGAALRSRMTRTERVLWHLHPESHPRALLRERRARRASAGASAGEAGEAPLGEVPLRLLHAADVREGACTENLEAWLALSPCAGSAGLGALLHRRSALSHEVVRSSRHTSLRLRLISECVTDEGGDHRRGGSSGCASRLRLGLSFTAVLPADAAQRALPALSAHDAYVSSTRDAENGGVGGGGSARAGGDGGSSAPESGGRPGLHACPVARSSTLHLELPTWGEGSSRPEVQPTPDGDDPRKGATATATANGMMARFAWALPHAPEAGLRVTWRYPSEGGGTATPAAPRWRDALASSLTVSRSVVAPNDREGTLVLHLEARDSRVAHRVRLTDVLPGWLPPYWHSLRAWRNGSLVAGDGAPAPIEALLDDLTILPAEGEGEWPAGWRRGASGTSPPLYPPLGMASGAASATSRDTHLAGTHLLAFAVTVPPRTRLEVALDFAKPVRHVDLMPADASRGLDVGPAVAWVVRYDGDNDGKSDGGTAAAEEDEGEACNVPRAARRFTLYTEAAIVPVPIVDASMPFNVVAISSTLVALFVGSMFNTLVAKPANVY